MIVLKRALVYTHRWLGIAGGLLFIAWFASGVVMMYARMPELSEAERLAQLPFLDLSTARVELADVFSLYGEPDRVRISTTAGRPVYRFQQRGRWNTVFADDGGQLPDLSREDATQSARRFAPDHAGTLSYDRRLTDVDQWTFGVRALMPLHRIALGDAQDTVVYVSDRTGEPALITTASSRRWGYAGAVLHWWYFTPLRRRGALWTQLVIWASAAGCVLTITGLVWGLWRAPARSPYTGLLRWHHYAGLLFGATTLAWVFSGLLSMEPWSLSPDTAPTRQQRQALSGGPLQFKLLSLARLRSELDTPVKELELSQFRGEPFAVPASPASSARPPLPEAALLAAAQEAMPSATMSDSVMLARYDAYYYDRAGGLPLPVLRVRYDDPQGTFLYIDPVRGTIVNKEVRGSRVYRWLYRGFHSFDFPFLYYRRPLWDIVVIALSIGGLVLSATTLLPGWQRLGRSIRGRRARG